MIGYWSNLLSHWPQYSLGDCWKPETEANAKFQPKRSKQIKNKRKKKKR